jgi:hypothetical protein
MLCTKYGCDYQLDLDGQVTCTQCGAMDDDKEPTNVTPISWGGTPISFEE